MSFAASALAWFVTLSSAAAAVWAIAAFVFRFSHNGRMLTTLGAPTLIAAAWIWWGYHTTTPRGVTPGIAAEVGFLVSSLLIGGVLGLLILPVWFLVEGKLGWRTLNP